jgi:hypothetical protein
LSRSMKWNSDCNWKVHACIALQYHTTNQIKKHQLVNSFSLLCFFAESKNKSQIVPCMTRSNQSRMIFLDRSLKGALLKYIKLYGYLISSSWGIFVTWSRIISSHKFVLRCPHLDITCLSIGWLIQHSLNF